MLATFEALGKLAFAPIAGWALDVFGLELVFPGFVVLGLLCIPAAAAIPGDDDGRGEDETELRNKSKTPRYA